VLPKDIATRLPISLFRESGLKLELVVERGDHIVPSFQEIWHNKPNKSLHKQVTYLK
jgi:hypothetical protein